MLIPISVLVYCVAGGIKVGGPLLKLLLLHLQYVKPGSF